MTSVAPYCVDDAIAAGAREPRGLLIATLHAELPPGERPEPFPPNVIEYATARGYCLLTGSQLYEALRRDQRGELDRAAFRRALLDTAGPRPASTSSAA